MNENNKKDILLIKNNKQKRGRNSMCYVLNSPFFLTFEVKKILKRKENGYTVAEINAKQFEKSYTDTKFKIMKLRGTFPIVFEGDAFKAKVIIKESYKYGYYLVIKSDLTYELPHTKKALISFLKKKVSNLKTAEAEELVAIGGRKTISKLVNDTDSFFEKTSLSNTRVKNIKKKLQDDVFFEDLMLFMQTMRLGAVTASYIYQQFGITSITKLRENPYHICQISEISFKEADIIAKNLNIRFNDKRRVKSSILEYLYFREKNNGDLCIPKEQLMSELNSFLAIYGNYKLEDVQKIEDASLDNELDKRNIKKRATKQKQQKKSKRESKISDNKIKDIIENTVKKEEIKEMVISDDIILEAYARLIEKKKIIEIQSSEGITMVYLKHLFDAEVTIAKNIEVLLSTPNPLLPERKVNNYLKKNPDNAKKQNDAILSVFKNRCSILTGGPGTGKTFTVNQIVTCLKKYKPDAKIRLLAPTGRASSKLSEVTNLPSSTIHRAIHLRPTTSNSFYLQEGENDVILDDDLVIVDESSMNDAIIFSKLLESISLTTTLLIVGDDNQLSPVGPGLVLRDLIESNIVPVTCLDEIYRQAKESQIVTNAHKLKEGITSKDENGLTFDKEKGDFYFIQRNSIETIANAIVNVTLRTMKVKKVSIWDIMLLSPIKDDIIGVYNLNRELQAKINPPTKDKEEYIVDGLTTLRVGDKVINTKNDEDLEINNGDIGKIVEIEIDQVTYEPKITVEFNMRTVCFDIDNIKNLELAYCITVHKSQGTEADVIIMPISPIHEFNLNKRLVYTAWTRAKKMVICVGDLKTLDKIATKDEIPRQSLLKERLVK